jgi:alpha-beta hydrolase superfamily lysophospholipase
MVVLLHGFTGWKEEEHLATLAGDLTRAGIAALRFDAPGSGESEGTWADHYRVSTYLADISVVCEYAMHNLQVDSSRVGIWGHSMGGMIAVMAASRSPRRFLAVCGSQPSPGGPRLASESAGEWTTVKTEHFGTIRLPSQHFQERAQVTTATEVRAVSAPLLLIAGEHDDLVPAESVRGIYDSAAEPKWYLEFATGHYYKRNPAMLQKINAATVEFFRRHLLAHAAVVPPK